MNKVKAVLIDLSGTLHIEDIAIPGAAESLKRLKENGFKIKFVTNTTKESKQMLCDRLNNLGFIIEKNEIFSSLTASSKIIKDRNLRPMLFLEKIALDDFAGIDQENPNSVVIGLAPSMFNYEHIDKAFKLIKSGAPLIGIHKGRYYKKKDGNALGPGAFITALEFACDIKAEIIGKPQPAFFLEALSALNVEPENAVMIGDDVRDDIGGAQNVGITGILVKTGKYKEGDEEKISPPPRYVAEDFVEAVEIIANI